MIKKIALALLLLLAGFLGFVAFQPSDFTITRSATIPAPAAP